MQTTTLLATQSYITGAAVESVLKFLTGRQRPYFTDSTRVQAEPIFHGPLYKTPRAPNGKRTNSSFPSGHTTTAFSIFLLGCLLIPKKWVVPVGFIYGCLVAYSRVYLAEHFPLDLGGGMLTAVATVWLSLLIQRAWDRRGKKVQ